MHVIGEAAVLLLRQRLLLQLLHLLLLLSRGVGVLDHCSHCHRFCNPPALSQSSSCSSSFHCHCPCCSRCGC